MKHLLQDVPSLGLGTYRGRGNNEVTNVRYVETERAVYINDKQCFSPITADVWNFHIGDSE